MLSNHRVKHNERVKSGTQLIRRLRRLQRRILILIYAASASSTLLLGTGCVSGTSGNTHATLLITATNNAQISIFKFNLKGLTLVASDGSSVPLLSTPQVVELGSINGVARPLVALDVPQGIYTSVKLTYGPSIFVVIDRSGGAGTFDEGNYNILTPESSPVTVEQQLNAPLVVAGSAMGILLDLNIPKSTTYTPYLAGSSSLAPGGGKTTFNPVYSLSPVTLAAQPSTLLDGKVEGVHGQISTTSGGAFTIAADSGTPLSFVTSSSTIFAGANGAAAPPIGGFVDVDAALQADGSMLATFVQTEGATQQYNIIGQILQYTEQLYLENTGREQQGPNLPNGTGFYMNNVQFSSSPQFEIAWPNGTIPAGLPFTPTLIPSSIIPGQNVSTPVDALQTVSTITPTTNIVTLEPQTIDGTVAQVSTVNGQTSYQVNLFSNDFITLFGPSQQVMVYVTAATHTITTSTLTSGSVERFRGLLFNDAGTLRMVATEVVDGVAGS